MSASERTEGGEISAVHGAADKMVEDMANGEPRRYEDPFQAAIGERVSNLNRRVTDIEVEMRSGFNQMAQSIDGLSKNLNERARPQWQAIGVSVSFFALIGALAYWPIREATGDLKTAVATIAERMITREEINARSVRESEDRERTDRAMVDLRNISVGRPEWMERNRSIDLAVAELSRRVDEVREAVGSQYTTRDLLLSLQNEVKELREK